MKQEDKELLLKDLCARVPYRTFVCLNPGAYNKPETCILTGVHGEKVHLNVDSDPFRVYSIKPYLHPMSSMTEDEDNELNSARMGSYGEDVDWLNAHHFDYSGLIEKGLALEAPEGMYKID